jgi:hypothetical protein
MTDLSKNWAAMSDPARIPQFRRLLDHPLQKRRRPARRARRGSPVAERPASAAPKAVLVDRPPGLPRWPLLSLPASGGRRDGQFPMGREDRSGADRGIGGLRGYSPLVRQLWQQVAPLPSEIRWTRLCPVKLYRAPILPVCGRGRSR